MTRQYTQRGLTVPYIAAWSRESLLSPPIERRTGKAGPFLAYVDETPYDRDEYGALWVRQALARGRGRAKFATAHALRQRQAAARLLCQVCGTDTLMTSPDRQLFVLKDTGQPVTEGEWTTAPPVCPSCAQEAVRDCPHLRPGHVAAWVSRPQVIGVAGVLYDPKTLRRVPLPRNRATAEITYDDPRIRWILASRLVTALHQVTPVELDELTAAPPADRRPNHP